MRGFIGITGHFILNWQLESVMIVCKRVKGRHTAEKIRLLQAMTYQTRLEMLLQTMLQT